MVLSNKYISILSKNFYELNSSNLKSTIKNVVFIDTSYFIFYRFHALINWFKLIHKDKNIEDLNISNNNEFIEKFKELVVEKIKEIPKKLDIYNEPFTICFGKDCPRNKIWRNKYHDNYKGNRIDNSNNYKNPSQFFKIFYQEKLYKQAFEKSLLIDYDTLEADDCIALSVKKIQKLCPNIDIHIITSDHDYLQLINNDKIHIKNLQFKSIRTDKNSFFDNKKDLLSKIITGDKSDNIQPIFKKCGKKTVEKYINDYELFNKQLSKEKAFEKLKNNTLLIDFEKIPEYLKEDFYNNYKFIFTDLKM